MVVANGEQFEVEAMLDTGFTSGWLAINSQDLEAIEWPIVIPHPNTVQLSFSSFSSFASFASFAVR
ncbi:hypothetical protein [uncultured Nostoc sp.]|uniref:hypothetical protein n=1 Tax=uncultured Nostoc sp. TaxID=340711 RepID=UPI0035CC3F5F